MQSKRILEIAASLARTSPVPLDQLPYSPHFGPIYQSFLSQTGLKCSEHECWLSLLGARKRGLVGGRNRQTPSACLTE